MLVGYVSDERYVALADVVLEFTTAGGESFEARSRAGGAVHVDLPAKPGEWLVTLQKPGYGSKRVRMTPRDGQPFHFRLLSDGLLGYVWPKWVRAGEPAELRVHSVDPYKLELWRCGWTKQLVRHLGWHDEHGPRATMQLTPDGDYTQAGVAWNTIGYPNADHRPGTIAPEKSGLYYIHATTLGGSSFTFPWIVAPARPQSPIAVLASNITWNVYNNFGGRSNYIHAEGLPEVPIVNARQESRRYADAGYNTWGAQSYPPLSFDRPEPINHIDPSEQITDPIEGRSACHLAPAEWRLLGWLEREGFSYDFYGETQLHEGVLDLSKYNVLILSTHPEYWTRRMYDTVKSWVFDAGGKLLYLGGNGLNCEVELPGGDRVICHNTAITSLWPDGMGGAESRFARRHEADANLLGVVFTPAGAMTAAPYRVVDGAHWVFQSAGLRTGDVFGERSLHMRCPGGASGHETDKRSRAHSPKNLHLLARGLNPADGGADMTIFDTPTGGAVFSAGSICYPSSLPVDADVSRVTAAVLRRFLD
jgi:N,N-dimethylformamidase